MEAIERESLMEREISSLQEQLRLTMERNERLCMDVLKEAGERNKTEEQLRQAEARVAKADRLYEVMKRYDSGEGHFDGWDTDFAAALATYEQAREDSNGG